MKDIYSRPGSEQEVRVGRFRIDVVHRGRLIEIQHSSLGAIRDKIRVLLETHKVDLVKPLVAKKMLIKLDGKEGEVVSKRWSPLRGTRLDVFQELLHFSNVFPHPNLRLITPLVEIEELRYPGHGRRRRWRENDFVVQDQRIIEVLESHEYRSAADLGRLLPGLLPDEFDTNELAGLLEIRPADARRITWVLRKTGAAKTTGKRGNRIVHSVLRRAKKKLAT